MAHFNGTFKHDRDENLEELFTKMGVGLMTRKVAVRSKPTLEVKVEGDVWTIVTKVTLKTVTWTFKLNEETETDGLGGKTKSIFTVEGNDLIQKSLNHEEGKGMKNVRSFSADGIKQTLTHLESGTTAVRHYKRV